MRITTATEYAAAIARTREINGYFGRMSAEELENTPADHPLELEIAQIYEAIDAYLDAEVYANVCPCNF